MSNGTNPVGFPLTRGYRLNPGDRVDTRQGGKVVIDLSDGSLIVVQRGTLLSVKDFCPASSMRELFDIVVGTVRVKIHHLTGRPNPYRTNSPTASIAVRGTEFEIAVEPGGDTKVDVFEGAVEVGRLDNPQESALIEARGGVMVGADRRCNSLASGSRESRDLRAIASLILENLDWARLWRSPLGKAFPSVSPGLLRVPVQSQVALPVLAFRPIESKSSMPRISYRSTWYRLCTATMLSRTLILTAWRIQPTLVWRAAQKGGRSSLRCGVLTATALRRK